MLRYSYLPQTYDPNRLFDALLRKLHLSSDEALCNTLGIVPFLLVRIRNGDYPVVPELLIRINEISGINVQELHRIMGDRRSQFRMGGDAGAAQRRTWEANRAAAPALAPAQEKLIESGDGDSPKWVQWR